MIHEVVFPFGTYQPIRDHVLRHIRAGEIQEDLCFALWQPSTGHDRYSAIIGEFILPKSGETELHGNVSFSADYLCRSLNLALQRGAGIALIHSHPTPGWQQLSGEDIIAERDRIGMPSKITNLPIVGVTFGSNEDMSARFWYKKSSEPVWCKKVRAVGGNTMAVTYNENLYEKYSRIPKLKRTIDSWGLVAQQKLARLKIGIVGVGSVGAFVAELLARMGIENLILIDPDEIEQHNLDRLIHAGEEDIGKLKVELIATCVRRAATARQFRLTAIPEPLQALHCYRAALDCDVLFSCVDRPLPKDLLNNIAFVHCIPVIFGGIKIARLRDDKLTDAAWIVSRITPDTRCLRCSRQYSVTDVVQDDDGTLDAPHYVNRPGVDQPDQQNQNVIAFSASLASQMVNELIRYVISEPWWPPLHASHRHNFVTHSLSENGKVTCEPQCEVRMRTGVGDSYKSPFLVPGSPSISHNPNNAWSRFAQFFKDIFSA